MFLHDVPYEQFHLAHGDTLLHPVHATLGQSVIVASGSVVNETKQKGHQITLDVTTPRARIDPPGGCK